MNLEPKMTFPKPTDRGGGPPLPLLPTKPPVEAYPADALPPLMREAAQAIAYHVQAPLPLV